MSVCESMCVVWGPRREAGRTQVCGFLGFEIPILSSWAYKPGHPAARRGPRALLAYPRPPRDGINSTITIAGLWPEPVSCHALFQVICTAVPQVSQDWREAKKRRFSEARQFLQIECSMALAWWLIHSDFRRVICLLGTSVSLSAKWK
jgi:hypothetical protein